MKLIFAKSKLTCVDLETTLGLVRGDISEINVLRDGTVEVEVSKELTPTQKNTLQNLLGLTEKVA